MLFNGFLWQHRQVIIQFSVENVVREPDIISELKLSLGTMKICICPTVFLTCTRVATAGSH